MPKGRANVPTIRAAPDFIEKHAERIQHWKDIVRSDPRRAVRTLTLRGFNAESIEGDTISDSPYVLAQMREISRDRSERAAWVKLVDAGVVTALCKCALNFQAMLMQHPDGGTPSTAEMERMSKQMMSPYHPPLEIICFSIETSPRTPSATELRVVADVRPHWNAIVQRIWSEPARSLDPEPKATVERLLVAQLIMLFTTFEPSFLEMPLKPGDMTLAVVMRNWMHSTSKLDHKYNAAILGSFLGGAIPQHWAGYVREHPFPEPRLVLARILVGASKAIEGDKKTKRTPAQAADAIVSAFATHFEKPEQLTFEPEICFLQELLSVCVVEHRPFVRALLKSGRFWSAVASTICHAERTRAPSGPPTVTQVLQVYVAAGRAMEKEGQDYIDMTIYNWATGGLFDALEAVIDMDLLERWPPSAMVMTNIFLSISTHLSKLSARTLTALRAELPRHRIVKRLIVASSTLTGDAASEAKKREADRGYVEFLSGQFPDASNAVWLQGAWQILTSLTFEAENAGACARRGCDRRADRGAATTCASMCKATVPTSYCSKACLQKDAEEHRHVCGWVHVLENCRHQEEGAVEGGRANEPSGSVVPDPDVAHGMSLLRLD